MNNEKSDLLKSEIKNFLDTDGKIKTYPGKRQKQLSVLQYLATKFEPGKVYTETEVNAVIGSWHTFADWVRLRRDLCDAKLLSRDKDGKAYQLSEESE